MLDVLVAAAVEEAPLSSPPATPAVGSCYLLGPNPTGAWAGKADQLAAYSSGGWRFIAAQEGMSVLVKSSGVVANYRGGSWDVGTIAGARLVVGGQQVVGPRSAAIAAPAGGTAVDAEGRTAIGLILAALRGHGLIAP